MMKTCICGLFLFAATSGQASQIDVYILTGQSNAAGRAQIGELGNDLDSTGVPYGSYLINSDAVLYANRERNSGTNEIALDQPFGDLRVKDPFSWYGLHGPELSLARDLAANSSTPVAVVKYVLGGSRIDRWLPESDDLYPEFLGYVLDRETELISLGHTVNWKGVFWVQGEADSFPAFAPSYATKFTELFDALRTDLGNPALPVVMAQLKSNLTDRPWFPYSESNPYSQQINLDMLALAAGDSTLAMTGSNNDLLVRDGIHYEGEAYIELGHRLADTYSNLLEPFADFDGDTDVDGHDFLKWQRGDTPGIGSVAELAAWESQFGMTSQPAFATNIPEPATLTLVLLSLCLAVGRQRTTPWP